MSELQINSLEQLNPILKANSMKHLDLGSFIEAKVSMEKFKHFEIDVGSDGIQFVGLPGSGKTSFAMLICKDLVKERNENIIVGGDRFCEFRHFFRYPRIIKRIVLFLPLQKQQQLYFYNFPSENEINKQYNTKGLQYEQKYVNFESLNINDYLTENTHSTIFVIYDNHYQGSYLWKRAELWKRITKQLLERVVLLNESITTLYNEAGILWQEGASGNHWKEVNEYSEIVVECRKGLVRIMLLSQLETEIYHPIRKKMLWKCYRLGTTSKFVPSSVKKAAPFQSRSAYILMYGGMFKIGNQTPKLTQLKETWKIIPIGEPNIEELDSKSNNNKQKSFDRDYVIKELYNSGLFKQKRLSELFNISQRRIREIVRDD